MAGLQLSSIYGIEGKRRRSELGMRIPIRARSDSPPVPVAQTGSWWESLAVANHRVLVILE
jgi:hypothetical protein